MKQDNIITLNAKLLVGSYLSGDRVIKIWFEIVFPYMQIWRLIFGILYNAMNVVLEVLFPLTFMAWILFCNPQWLLRKQNNHACLYSQQFILTFVWHGQVVESIFRFQLGVLFCWAVKGIRFCALFAAARFVQH